MGHVSANLCCSALTSLHRPTETEHWKGQRDVHVQAEDRNKFSREWTRLALADVSAESRMRRGAHELAERHPAKPRQLTQIESVDQLMDQAQAAEEPLHQAMSAFVRQLGGHYNRGVS